MPSQGVALGRLMGLIFTVALGLPAQAIEVVRSERSLKHKATRLVSNVDAPRTQLNASSTNMNLASSSPETRLSSSVLPRDSLLRETEIPSERLALTSKLITELGARQTSDLAISIDLPADVLFDFDKHDLRPDSAGPLAKAVDLVRSYPNAPLEVIGHTDAKGSDAYNDALSLRRAVAVESVLREKTGRKGRTEGMGKRRPVSPNVTVEGQDDPAGRQQNRRVQILIHSSARQGIKALRHDPWSNGTTTLHGS